MWNTHTRQLLWTACGLSCSRTVLVQRAHGGTQGEVPCIWGKEASHLFLARACVHLSPRSPAFLPPPPPPPCLFGRLQL